MDAAFSGNTLVYRRRRRKGYRWLKILGLFIVAYIIFSFGQQYLKEQRLGSQLALLEDQKRLLALQKNELRERISLLQKDYYIEKIAREELGLVKAGEVVIIRAQTASGHLPPVKKLNSQDLQE